MSLEDMVQNHHDPQRSKNKMEASIVHLADIITNAMGIGTSGERFVPPLMMKHGHKSVLRLISYQ